MEQPIVYLLDDAEVVLTGRIAKRKLKNNKIIEKVEIKPAKSDQASWTRWIDRSELYVIE